jgi:hypothetical protein
MRFNVFFLLVVGLVVPVAGAEDPAEIDVPEKEVSLEEWCVGKSRSEVVELLGKPSKKKKRDGQRIFLYAWDGSPAQPGGVFPGSGPYVTSAPLPLAASPQPSEAEAVGGSKAPPLPPNLQELRDAWDPEAEDAGARKSLAVLEITFGDDDRVASCRMVPRRARRAPRNRNPIDVVDSCGLVSRPTHLLD